MKVKGLLLHKEVLEEAGAGVGGLRQDEDPAPVREAAWKKGLRASKPRYGFTVRALPGKASR